MSASNENSRSYKSKLSLQKKFKLDIPVVSNQLNETSDFRSVEKMQKFVSGVTVPGRNTRKGKSTKRALIVDDKKYVKSKKEMTSQKVEGKCEILAKEEKLNKIKVESAVVDHKTRKELDTVLDEVKEESSSVYEEVTNDDVKDVIEIDCDEEETKGTCLACGDDYGSQEMQAHVQNCLKARFQRGGAKGTIILLYFLIIKSLLNLHIDIQCTLYLVQKNHMTYCHHNASFFCCHCSFS
jgi:hypothetical protein